MNNFFKKFVMSLMTFVLGFSFANAEEENPITISVDPVKALPGSVIDIPVNYQSSKEFVAFQMDIYLPEGLSFAQEDKEFIVGGNALDDHTCSKKYREESNSFRVIFASLQNAPLKNGTLFTFKVKVDEKLADVSQIDFKKIKFARGGIYFTYSTEVKNMKKQWDINEAAQAKVNEALQATMKVLNDADQQINDNCVELLRDSYLDQLAECSSIINKKAVELSEKYTAIELTEKDAEDFAATCAEVQAKVATILAEASEMTKKYEANEKANKDFQTVYQALIDQLDKADATINDECPAVKDTYLDKLAEIAGQANKLGMEIGELYAACELTQEKADAAVATVKELADKIDVIVADAIKAQNIVTGINGINADFQNAEAVYSIEGVRMNKAAKGVNVVIRNGKAIKVVK